ncbi:uncharacterized protein LY79DRAFT_558289 [Colletotrichum navitas]|uniref:Secreted protein n=1 Tax=Colletotrichum navitas TaxID=681940 RepID=A0AAD8V358_9PEZI|nr:uncharacterized protein LY79DRAFT_558289 [Colletotrichum navitas]KAK1585533.1 hypothetical protein LY79DRAFT_558289 [Colletotrichum navitas]
MHFPHQLVWCAVCGHYVRSLPLYLPIAPAAQGWLVFDVVPWADTGRNDKARQMGHIPTVDVCTLPVLVRSVVVGQQSSTRLSSPVSYC